MAQGVKLTIIGAGAFRTPRLLYGLIKHVQSLRIDRIDLYDLSSDRLASMQAMGQYVADLLGSPIILRAQPSLLEACRDAAFVLLTYRVGGEEGRAIDERVAMDNGVLGQETVGPGGFFMALRSIPVTLQYMEDIRRIVPDAWVINFTNPAGTVAEAVARAGDHRFVGVCDTPYHLQMEIADFLQLAVDDLRVESVGLNHLGWFQRIWANGHDLLPDLLDHLKAVQQAIRPLSFFDPAYIQQNRALPTEYVYFYLQASEVLARLKEKHTRGEVLRDQAEAFWPPFHDTVRAGRLAEAWREYGQVITRRSNSYLATETGSTFPRGLDPDSLFASEGYEGVAIRVMEGVLSMGTHPVIVNVPAHGILPGFGSDVIECTSYIDRHGIVPLPFTQSPPASCLDLMRTVKNFEVRTVEAVQSRHRDDIVTALAANPLLGGNTALARQIIDARRSQPQSPALLEEGT